MEVDQLRYAAESGDVSIAVVGDVILNRPVRQYREPRFLDVVELLRDSDATVGNMETLYHNWEMSYGSNYNAAYQVAPPEMLGELQWLGFSGMSAAMNHAFDAGEAGLLKTLENCRNWGVPIAGAGMSLAEARSPAHIETGKGRVALLGGCTTFHLPDVVHAGPGRADFPGKPGISILRHEERYTVPSRVFDCLAGLHRGLELREPLERDEMRIFGKTLLRGNEYTLTTNCHPEDLDSIGRYVRAAKKTADWVIYSIHCHESGNRGKYYNTVHRPSTPDFLIEFAHFVIDQGCDVVFGHGPHILRGIEIYRGRPIFYSLGNFFFNVENLNKVPPPAYARLGLTDEDTPGDWAESFASESSFAWASEPACYQSVIAVCEFQSRELAAVKLYPVDLGIGATLSQRGRPIMADELVAKDIMNWISEVSQPFGTHITSSDDEIVQVRLPAIGNVTDAGRDN